MAKVKQGLQNLSLCKSIVLYIIIFVAVAILLSVFVTQGCRSVKERIAANYPQTGERYYLTNEAGEPLAILDGAFRRISDNDLDFTIDCTGKDEMGKLCASFEKMRFSLWRSNQLMWRQMEQRRHLNAAFAHDLRTPLTVLKGYAEILQFNDNTQAAKETAITMSKHIARLERYVDTMSSLQRMEDIVSDLQEVDLNHVLPQTRQMAELICDKAGNVCVFQLQISRYTAWLDIEIFSQVIENLVANAARSRLLTTLLEPASGTATILGMRAEKVNPNKIKRSIGYLPQEFGVHGIFPSFCPLSFALCFQLFYYSLVKNLHLS